MKKKWIYLWCLTAIAFVLGLIAGDHIFYNHVDEVFYTNVQFDDINRKWYAKDINGEIVKLDNNIYPSNEVYKRPVIKPEDTVTLFKENGQTMYALGKISKEKAELYTNDTHIFLRMGSGFFFAGFIMVICTVIIQSSQRY
jgi:hypothetical protein